MTTSRAAPRPRQPDHADPAERSLRAGLHDHGQLQREWEHTGGATAQQVNPIAVGYAVLDKDAPALGSDNLSLSAARASTPSRRP